jgi:hypothetical protein
VSGNCPYDGAQLDGASVCPICQRVFRPPVDLWDAWFTDAPPAEEAR